jgi:hypothetical protein
LEQTSAGTTSFGGRGKRTAFHNHLEADPFQTLAELLRGAGRVAQVEIISASFPIDAAIPH